MAETPLIEAVKTGDMQAIEGLIRTGADVHERDEHGWTPLNWAAGRGDAQAVALLLERGADVTLTGRDGRTALMIAKAAERRETSALLTEAEKLRGVWRDPRETRLYCKAHLLGDLRRSPEWPATADPSLGDDQIVYLHQDFTVTKSMWHGEDVLLDAPSPSWKGFCESTLGFAIPADLL